MHKPANILLTLAPLLLAAATRAATPATPATTPAPLDVSTFGISPTRPPSTPPPFKKPSTPAAQGGGTVSFPKGRYLTGTLQIKSRVTLRFDQDATLLGSTDAAHYRNLDPFIDGSGNPMGDALLVAVDADHVGIEGAGTIDGQGPGLKARQNPYKMRPFLIRWVTAPTSPSAIFISPIPVPGPSISSRPRTPS